MTSQEVIEENPLHTLYLGLNKACSQNDYEKVSRFSEKILKKYPDEFKAFHCKIIAQMQLNSFETALKSINSVENRKNELLFEKAYCEYRLNRLEQALETIKNAPQPNLRIQELQCQIYYKMENYEESFNRYKNLIRNINDSYEDERNVNMIANVAAMSQWQNKMRPFPNVPNSMFDVYINRACYLTANGEYDEALKSLDDAEKMCMSAFEDEDEEVAEVEVDEELCAIKVAKAYCLQMQNQTIEANNLYHEVLRKRCGESHVLAVAANNVVCINCEQNIFDSKKKIKVATSDNVMPKLMSGQRQEITINHCLFSYHSNQVDTLKSVSDKILEENPKCIRAALIAASQFTRDNEISKAIDYLENYLDIVEKTDIDNDDLVKVQLSLAQLYLTQSSISKCLDIISELPIPYLHTPGVLSTRVALCMMSEDQDGAIACLDGTLDWYRSEMAVTKKGEELDQLKEQYLQLVQNSAVFCENYQIFKEAAKYYKELLKLMPGDQGILASLIAAYSRFDRKLAEKTSLQLKYTKTLPEIDVDSLECAFIFGAKHMKKILKSTTDGKMSPQQVIEKEDTTLQLKKKNNKKKKKKLPKNCDSGKLPDPERWLPRRERTYYKGRKRDKRANIRGPQGATGGGSELDASKKTPSVPPTPNQEQLKSGGISSNQNSSAAAANTSQQVKSKVQQSAAFSKKNKGKKKKR